jgi:hypothetical protein
MTRRPLALVRFGAPTSEDEIDLGSGAFVLFPRLAASFREEPESGIGAAEPSTAGDLESDLATTTTAGVTDEGMVYRLSVLAAHHNCSASSPLSRTWLTRPPDLLRASR